MYIHYVTGLPIYLKQHISIIVDKFTMNLPLYKSKPELCWNVLKQS